MKRSPIDIKKNIIQLLRVRKRSLRELDIKTNCGYRTIIAQCEELRYLGIVKIIKHERNLKTGRPYSAVELTSQGKKIR